MSYRLMYYDGKRPQAQVSGLVANTATGGLEVENISVTAGTFPATANINSNVFELDAGNIGYATIVATGDILSNVDTYEITNFRENGQIGVVVRPSSFVDFVSPQISSNVYLGFTSNIAVTPPEHGILTFMKINSNVYVSASNFVGV